MSLSCSSSQISHGQIIDGIPKANGTHRAKEEHLNSDHGCNQGFQGQLGPQVPSTNVYERTKKTVLWSVIQRKPKPTNTATHESQFQIDPAVNRPQVLAPSSVESVRMRGLKEKTEHAFTWTRPTYPPPGPSSRTVSSTSSAVTNLFSKSTLAQSTRDAFISQRSRSTDDDISQRRGGLSTKWSGTTKNTAVGGQSAKNATHQTSKFRPILSSQSVTDISSGVNGGTPMGDLLKSIRSDGSDGGNKCQSVVVGPNEFLELYRSRAYSDSRRPAAGWKHRRYNSECQTTFSSFDEKELKEGGSGEIRQNPQSIPTRRISQTVLMELPDTIPEHVEMHFTGSCKSLPTSLATPPLSLTDSAEGQCSTASSSNSSSSASASSSPSPSSSSAADRRSRWVRAMGRRLSDPPMLSLQKLSTLRICYQKTMLAQQRNEPDSQNSSSSSSSLNSIISTSPKRLTEFSISPESLGIDPPLFSRQHLVVWRDQQSTQILKLPSSVEYHDTLQEIIDEDDSLIYSELMKLHRCWELMPNKSMVVVLDIELKVSCAFHAITVHGISAAVLWDSGAGKFVGMLTVTDFIRILQKYRNSKEDLERIKDDKISHWKEEEIVCAGLTSVRPDDSLYDVVCCLHSSGFHRLPVIDDVGNNVLYALGYKRILQFICLFINHLPRPNFMNRTICELNAGTFHDIASIREDHPLYEALDLLVERGVSALPVVDSEDRVVNIYCRTDAMALASNESYRNLNVTISETLSTERESFEGVFLCKRTDSLSQVVEWFVETKVHRFIVVDDERRLEGVVSLSDVIRFLILHPPRKDS